MEDLEQCEKLFRKVGHQLNWFSHRPEELLVKLAVEIREGHHRAHVEEFTGLDGGRAALAMADPPTQTRRTTVSRVRHTVNPNDLADSISTMQLESKMAIANGKSQSSESAATDEAQTKKKKKKKVEQSEKSFSFFPTEAARSKSPVGPSPEANITTSNSTASPLLARSTPTRHRRTFAGSSSSPEGTPQQELFTSRSDSLNSGQQSQSANVNPSPSSSSTEATSDLVQAGCGTPADTHHKQPAEFTRIQMLDDGDILLDHSSSNVACIDNVHGDVVTPAQRHHARVIDSSSDSSPVPVASTRQHRMQIVDSSCEGSPAPDHRCRANKRYQVQSDSSDGEDSVAGTQAESPDAQFYTPPTTLPAMSPNGAVATAPLPPTIPSTSEREEQDVQLPVLPNQHSDNAASASNASSQSALADFSLSLADDEDDEEEKDDGYDRDNGILDASDGVSGIGVTSFLDHEAASIGDLSDMNEHDGSVLDYLGHPMDDKDGDGGDEDDEDDEDEDASDVKALESSDENDAPDDYDYDDDFIDDGDDFIDYEDDVIAEGNTIDYSESTRGAVHAGSLADMLQSPQIDYVTGDGSLSFVLPSSAKSIRQQSRLVSSTSPRPPEKSLDGSELVSLCDDMERDWLAVSATDGDDIQASSADDHVTAASPLQDDTTPDKSDTATSKHTDMPSESRRSIVLVDFDDDDVASGSSVRQSAALPAANTVHQISNSSSSDEDGDDFEKFLLQSKTPRAQQKPTSHNQLDEFIVDDDICEALYVNGSDDDGEEEDHFVGDDDDLLCTTPKPCFETPSSWMTPSADQENAIPDNWTLPPSSKKGSALPHPYNVVKTPKRLPASTPVPSSAVAFKRCRNALVQHYFRLFNKSVFSNQLSPALQITWNNRMRTTSGYCITKRTSAGDFEARIELADKICDSEDRLRDTLLHELCHAAVWMVDRVKGGHGPAFKAWARIAHKTHPDIPLVTRCHSYSIATKYNYQCSQCQFVIGRHSKSIDVQRQVCPYCTSPLILVNGSNSKALTAFALYVKDNFKSIKASLPPTATHKHVMSKLSEHYRQHKQLTQ